MTIPSWARVGAKVAWIGDGSYKNGYGDEISPVVGVVYTIRAVEPDGDICCLLLVEIVNPTRLYRTFSSPIGGLFEPNFDAALFRPLTTRTIEQDVSIFAHHLNTVKNREAV